MVVEFYKNGPEVKADSEKTAWVLINFLTNAIGYSSEKSMIKIDLKIEKNKMVFQVVDKGQGIESQLGLGSTFYFSLNLV